MSWRAFTVGLIGDLAWPTVVMLVVLILRRPIVDLVRDHLTSVDAFGFRAEFDRRAAAVRTEVTRITAPGRPGQSETAAGPWVTASGTRHDRAA